MAQENLLLTPRRTSLPQSNGSPLGQLAMLASKFVSTPQNQNSTSKNSFKDEFSPVNKTEWRTNLSNLDKLKKKLDFNQQDLDLCSELSLLKNSPTKEPMKRRKMRISQPKVKADIIKLNPVKGKRIKKTNLSRKKTTKVKRPRQPKGTPPQRKKRKNEWNDDEIIALLQITKIMIDCELKSVAKALFECIKRSPGKSYGRAAEKKLKRMEIFENWKRCDNEKIITNINKKLIELGVKTEKVDKHVLFIATKYREAEMSQQFKTRLRNTTNSPRTSPISNIFLPMVPNSINAKQTLQQPIKPKTTNTEPDVVKCIENIINILEMPRVSM